MMQRPKSENISEEKSKKRTVVFKLGERPARDIMSFQSRYRDSARMGFASYLIKADQARPVLGARPPLDDDPILNGVYLVELEDFDLAEGHVRRLETDETVEFAYIAPPREMLAQLPTYASGSQTYHDSWHAQINLPQAQALPQWSVTRAVTVAVVDSGFDVRHPQLTHLQFNDYLQSPPATSDVLGHGSHVIGLIAAVGVPQNSFQGIAPDCTDVAAYRGIARPVDMGGTIRHSGPRAAPG